MEMQISKTFNIDLTEDEVVEIIKVHIKQKEGLNVDSVNFRIETKYDGFNDQYGTDVIGKIQCSGKLEN